MFAHIISVDDTYTIREWAEASTMDDAALSGIVRNEIADRAARLWEESIERFPNQALMTALRNEIRSLEQYA